MLTAQQRIREIIATIPADASLADVDAALGTAPPIELTPEEVADWETIGSTGTDLMRINIELFDRRGRRYFWNAGDLLDGDFERELADTPLVPRSFAARFTGAARDALAAAETMASERLVVLRAGFGDDARNDIVLQELRAGDGSAVQRSDLDQLTALTEMEPLRAAVVEISAAFAELQTSSAEIVAARLVLRTFHRP